MEPSIYLSEEGNKVRSKSPFIESKIKDEYNFASYKDANDMNQEEVIEILKEKGYLLKFINNPTEDMVVTALTSSKNAMFHVKNLTEGILNRLIEKDKIYTDSFDILHKSSFPYTLVYINNINLEYITKIVKETYSFYGIKINMLDKEFILEILKESGRGNLRMLIEQKDSFSKEDFTYFIDNLLKYKIEKRYVIKSRILTRLYDKKECQCEELCLAAIKIHWQNYQGVKIKSKEVYLECLKYNNRYTKDLLKFGVSIEEILSINGLALKYIENPTIEQIKIAIEQNGKAIEFVKDKTEELCLMAVQQDGLALRYIKSPSFDVSVKAAQNHPNAVMLLDKELRPMIREELKNQTLNFVNVDLSKSIIEEKLLVITNTVSVIRDMIKHNLNSLDHNDIINRCLTKLKNKTSLDRDTIIKIIKNQIMSINGITSIKQTMSS